MKYFKHTIPPFGRRRTQFHFSQPIKQTGIESGEKRNIQQNVPRLTLTACYLAAWANMHVLHQKLHFWRSPVLKQHPFASTWASEWCRNPNDGVLVPMMGGLHIIKPSLHLNEWVVLRAPIWVVVYTNSGCRAGITCNVSMSACISFCFYRLGGAGSRCFVSHFN